MLKNKNAWHTITALRENFDGPVEPVQRFDERIRKLDGDKPNDDEVLRKTNALLEGGDFLPSRHVDLREEVNGDHGNAPSNNERPGNSFGTGNALPSELIETGRARIALERFKTRIAYCQSTKLTPKHLCAHTWPAA